MSLGFIILAHTALGRAEQVIAHIAARDCPVVVHIDKRVSDKRFEKLRAVFADHPKVRFCKRVRVEWGTWSMVAATQLAAEKMLQVFPKAGHVYLASGSCLPLRPIEDLKAYLAERPQTDFIESVRCEEVDWIVDGLGHERFTLRFPFSWKKQRRLFDRYVALQRRVGFRRKLPQGMEPHLGSQWWCLTRRTLSAILTDPQRYNLDRWYKRVWIPDEAYFQTQVRKWSSNIESHSLTLSKFDHRGLPHVFYDDHLQLLRRSDCFMARKIWPNADKLYRTFLVPPGAAARMAEPNPNRIDRVFANALEQRTKGRPGLYMQSRFPRMNQGYARTSGPYNVFAGFDSVFEGFQPWMAKRADGPVHGHLFSAKGAAFADGTSFAEGGLIGAPTLRDYRAAHFLSNLLWTTRGEPQSFLFGPGDTQAPLDFMRHDPNARIFLITGAWAVPLASDTRQFTRIRKKAARLQARESDMLKRLREADVKARVQIWTLADFLAAPMDHLQDVLSVVSHRPHLTEVPQMRPIDGLWQFLQNLRNQGMKPLHIGDLQDPRFQPKKGTYIKPYVVS